MWLLPMVTVALLAALPFGPPQLVLPVRGLIGAAIAIAVALTSGEGRLYIPGGIFLLLGLSLGVANVERIVSGALTFRHYLRQS